MAIEKFEVKTARRSASNRYSVPVRQWRKWSAEERARFNEVYSAMVSNQRLFLHPKSEPVKRDLWKTTAWNAAWTAASA